MCLPPEEPVEEFEDPIVAEIRRVRTIHAAKFKSDLKRIVADFQRQERETGVKTVRRAPRRPAAPTRKTAA